jgi:hypothetical protein
MGQPMAEAPCQAQWWGCAGSSWESFALAPRVNDRARNSVSLGQKGWGNWPRCCSRTIPRSQLWNLLVS